MRFAERASRWRVSDIGRDRVPLAVYITTKGTRSWVGWVRLGVAGFGEVDGVEVGAAAVAVEDDDDLDRIAVGADRVR
jgi:hypothetical protein